MIRLEGIPTRNMRSRNSELLAHAGHELRTPLRAIIGFAERMANGKVRAGSDDHKEYVAEILTSSQHLLQIIDDALDLVRLETDSMEFRPERTDVGHLVAEVCDALDGLAAAKRIDVLLDIAVAEDVVLDSSKLAKILYNYLSNALKFTPDGGRITIRVRDTSECVRIEVEDTGIGIHPEDQHRLFIAFQRFVTGMGKTYPGAGLGLALTKRIVEAQQGEVGVKTEPGKGSTFWAVLPHGDIRTG